jgi:hypothetical protein
MTIFKILSLIFIFNFFQPQINSVNDNKNKTNQKKERNKFQEEINESKNIIKKVFNSSNYNYSFYDNHDNYHYDNHHDFFNFDSFNYSSSKTSLISVDLNEFLLNLKLIFLTRGELNLIELEDLENEQFINNNDQFVLTDNIFYISYGQTVEVFTETYN